MFVAAGLGLGLEVVEVVLGEGLEVKKLCSEMVEVGAVPEDGV